jgi:uncharacterized protein (DUF433 family)
MNLERLNRITVEPTRAGGVLAFAGSASVLRDVLELLAAGASFEEIIADYPFLEREDTLRALDYGAYQRDHVVLLVS